MIDNEYYPNKYKTAEARALFLVTKKTVGTFTALASLLGFTPTYFSTIISKGLPLKYAGYLGRKYNFNPALLAYEQYIQFTQCTKNILPYVDTVASTDLFSKDDQEYILGGTYIKDPVKYLRQLDKKVK